MREIKFRVWDCLSRKMLGWGDIFHLPAWEIFPGTPEQRAFDVMQYTGLKDVNGKEIYEGDIVTIFDDKTIGLIKFSSEDAMFLIDLGCSCTLRIENSFTVIGNIYENPELWEGNYD